MTGLQRVKEIFGWNFDKSGGCDRQRWHLLHPPSPFPFHCSSWKLYMANCCIIPKVITQCGRSEVNGKSTCFQCGGFENWRRHVLSARSSLAWIGAAYPHAHLNHLSILGLPPAIQPPQPLHRRAKHCLTDGQRLRRWPSVRQCLASTRSCLQTGAQLHVSRCAFCLCPPFNPHVSITNTQASNRIRWPLFLYVKSAIRQRWVGGCCQTLSATLLIQHKVNKTYA